VSDKHEKIDALTKAFRDQSQDARYLAFFHCFNQRLYFEAHEVLEALWLGERGGPRDLFYKGLIQLAGAFVHVQKNRRGPALALLAMARSNLLRYPDYYENLSLPGVLAVIDSWTQRLAAGELTAELLERDGAPTLALEAE
jgi:predicted metal-dependent hydrolase